MDELKRISAIVDLVAYDTMADIGTDHGYISILCGQKKEMKRIIACDVNQGPLNNCKANIEKYQQTYLIETRLSDGIDKIQEGEVDTIVIAGMGGNLTVGILETQASLAKTFQQWVLQPQSMISSVRQQVHQMGFSIREEVMVEEAGHFYTILDCRNTPEPSYTLLEYTYGKRLLDTKNPLLKKHLSLEKSKLLALEPQILEGCTDKSRILAIQQKIEMIQKGLEVL